MRRSWPSSAWPSAPVRDARLPRIHSASKRQGSRRSAQRARYRGSSPHHAQQGARARTAGTAGLAGVIISVLIGLLVTYFLYMFASKAKKGMEGLSEYDVNIGFANFKNYFLVIGILVIIGLVFFLFAMIAVGTLAGMN